VGQLLCHFFALRYLKAIYQKVGFFMTHANETLFDTSATGSTSAVECLGITFPNDDARRAYFLDKLREKLEDSAFRRIEGFPLGSDEDILELSDPPYYTACPNPFIEDFIAHYGTPYDPTVPYTKEPFAADVSEGRGDPIYNAHSYHTKVPYKAIMRYILHYTKPGDIVLDGFCGTGMTGVAAQMCGNPDPEFKLKVEQEWRDADLGQPDWGARRAVLGDLSPAATFIAYNYCTSVDVQEFEREAKRVLAEAESECGWMYETTHSDGTKGRISYTVWSDVFVCQQCGGEVVFWHAAVDKNAGAVRDEFPCPHCHARLTKRSMEPAWNTKFDQALGQTIRQAKQTLVLINYSVGKKRFEKTPDDFDFALVEKTEAIDILHWLPTERLPVGSEARRNDDIGITHTHHFFTKRNLRTISTLFKYAPFSSLQWAVTGIMQRASKQHQIAITRIGGEKAKQGGATAGHRRGTLYVPSNQVEFHPIELLTERLTVILKTLKSVSLANRDTVISTGSTEYFDVPSETIDYIFVDPPFGGNIMYSELNFQWEAWLKVFTNNNREAVQDRIQHKGLLEYQDIMAQCFQEFYRMLKSGHWITVEFHNSKNSVWNAIQEALQRAGFVVADVRTLNKQLLTHTQRTAAGSVSQDLVISAYKPNGALEERFQLDAGSTEGVWAFIRTHLRQLPIFVQGKDGQADVVDERLHFLLYDRMVAFHVQRGVSVPVSAAEFYAGLTQHFPDRDNMYFLPEQVAEYERKRMTVREVQQLPVFVSDEPSAILWLRQQLINKPQTTGELTPQFMQELGGWQKHELLPELVDLLEYNFLRYDGKGAIPAQIISWMKKSSHLRDLIQEELAAGRATDGTGELYTAHPKLLAEARDRWYVPDPNRAIDLEKIRSRTLLQEFASYHKSKGRLKQFRTEAIRAGFAQAWKDKQYTTIVELAERLPASVLQEDQDLLMYYDNANLRVH